jgi:hypothetical protein
VLIKLEIRDGYWDWTHENVVPGEFNCPDDFSTWDMKGGNNDDPDPQVSLNGSESIGLKTLGLVIKKTVAFARHKGCGDYEVIDLTPGR